MKNRVVKMNVSLLAAEPSLLQPAARFHGLANSIPGKKWNSFNNPLKDPLKHQLSANQKIQTLFFGKMVCRLHGAVLGMQIFCVESVAAQIGLKNNLIPQRLRWQGGDPLCPAHPTELGVDPESAGVMSLRPDVS